MIRLIKAIFDSIYIAQLDDTNQFETHNIQAITAELRP